MSALVAVVSDLFPGEYCVLFYITHYLTILYLVVHIYSDEEIRLTVPSSE